MSVERRMIAVNGTVQGVGFRPFVYGLASRLALGGFVKNDAGGVVIEIEGEDSHLDQFLSGLRSKSPPLAHIEKLTWEQGHPIGDKNFRIQNSENGEADRSRYRRTLEHASSVWRSYLIRAIDVIGIHLLIARIVGRG